MAAMAMNCKLVKPVSNTKLSWIARSMASAGRDMVSEQVAGSENHPLVGMERLVGPVEVTVVGQQVVADQQRDLGVADLAERPQGRPPPPRAVAPEAGHAQLGPRARVLHEGDRAVVELDQLNPSRVEVVEQMGLTERRAHTEHGGVLVPLVRDVLR